MASAISIGLTKTLSELLLYGIYLVLFAAVVYLFHRDAMLSKHRPPLLEFGIVVQFLVVTAHLIASIVEAYFCLNNAGGGVPAQICFLNTATPVAVANIAFFILTSIITDILVIHRLYVIWTRSRKVIVAPLVLLLVQAVGGSGVVVTLASGRGEHKTVLSLSNAWAATTLVASLVISVYSSGMIFWKISRIASQFETLEGQISGGGRLMSAVAIIIESAGIQTSVTITLLIVFESGFEAADVLTGIGPAVFGISTVLIHARVGLGWATQQRDSMSSRQGQTITAGTVRLEPFHVDRRSRRDGGGEV
ncbi:hypothetical protein B0H19DRAFT_1261837 [Mycena capillaripes]|nr:hypothetical protein B0H19DRAFT_1261837 [Mycena capillaripes]